MTARLRPSALVLAAALLLAACGTSGDGAELGSSTTAPGGGRAALELRLTDAPSSYTGSLVDDTLGDLGTIDLVVTYDLETGMVDFVLDIRSLSPVAQGLPLADMIGDLGPEVGQVPYGEKVPVDGTSDDLGPYRGSYEVPGAVELEAYDIPLPEFRSASLEGTIELSDIRLSYVLVLADGTEFRGNLDMLPDPNDFACDQAATDPETRFTYEGDGWALGAGIEYELAPRARVGLQMLGWNREAWNEGAEPPASYGLSYAELSDDEAFAAELLCVTPDAWDDAVFPSPRVRLDFGPDDGPTASTPDPTTGGPDPTDPRPGASSSTTTTTNPATATIRYGKTCYAPDGMSGTFEVALSSSAPGGGKGRLVLTSDHPPSPRQANATAAANGNLTFTFPVGGPGEYLYLDSLTVDGVPYTVQFPYYETPPIEESCVEERP